MPRKGQVKDLTGQRFGRLLVLSRAEDYIQPDGKHITMWNCLCDCGNECVKRAATLKKEKNFILI